MTRHIFFAFAFILSASSLFAADESESFWNRHFQRVTHVEYTDSEKLHFTLDLMTPDNFGRFLPYFQNESDIQAALMGYNSRENWVEGNSHIETIKKELKYRVITDTQVQGFLDCTLALVSAASQPINDAIRFMSPETYTESGRPYPERLYIARISDGQRTLMSTLIAVSPDGTTQALLSLYRSISYLFRSHLGVHSSPQTLHANLSGRLHEFTMAALQTRFSIARPVFPMADILLQNGFQEVRNEDAASRIGLGRANLRFFDVFFAGRTNPMLLDRTQLSQETAGRITNLRSQLQVIRSNHPASHYMTRQNSFYLVVFALLMYNTYTTVLSD